MSIYFWSDHFTWNRLLDIICTHEVWTPREETSFTPRPKIHSHSQIFRYGQSIFCLPHWPNFLDICDLCLHWVSVVRVCMYLNFYCLQIQCSSRLFHLATNHRKALNTTVLMVAAVSAIGYLYSSRYHIVTLEKFFSFQLSTYSLHCLDRI